MTYALGIDLGTTYTAAAVARGGRAEVVALGYRATSVPSVVLLTADGRFLVGDAAERRAAHEPDRVAREFKRRVGDPTPLLLGGTPVAVDRCLAEMLQWVVTTAGEAEGGPPATVTVTHPANWGEFKRDVLREALRLAEIPQPRLLAEPVAAATWYAQAERMAPGRTIAVYDLGGGTFDTTVLRRRADGKFEALGRTEGIERLGGIDIDQAVFGYVLRALGEDGAALERGADDPALMAATAQLRRACVEAKEALSSETSVTIPVWFPGVHHEVLLHRTEMEELVGPLLRPTVDALGRVLASARLQPSDLDAVLLVGGSSRIPLITRQVSAGLGRPVALDAHPKHPVALGAAIDAMAHLATAAPAAAPPTAVPAGPGAPVGPGAAAAWPAAHGRNGPAPPGSAVGAAAPTAFAGQAGPAAPAGASWPVYQGVATNGGRPQASVQDAPPYRTLPPLPPPRPGGEIDRSSRRFLMLASLATPVILLLFIVFYVVQGRDAPSGNPRTDDDVSSSTTIAGQTAGSTPTTGSTAAETTGPVDLLQTDASPALSSFATIYGSTTPRVDDMVLYNDFATISVQTQENPTYFDTYEWREGQLTGPDDTLIPPDEDDVDTKLFDLSELDPAVIPNVVQQTLPNCPGDGFVVSHAIIERDIVFDDQHRVLIQVYASNPERSGTGGFVSFTLDGTLVESVCD